MPVTTDNVFHTSIGNVTFEPAVRTNWHFHPRGHILLVAGEKGRYQEQSKPVRGYSSNGLTSEEIASDLQLSVKTVEVHWSNIMKKPQVENMAGLSAFSIAQRVSLKTRKGTNNWSRQKSLLPFRGGYHAFFIFPKPPVPPAGNKTI